LLSSGSSGITGIIIHEHHCRGSFTLAFLLYARWYNYTQLLTEAASSGKLWNWLNISIGFVQTATGVASNPEIFSRSSNANLISRSSQNQLWRRRFSAAVSRWILQVFVSIIGFLILSRSLLRCCVTIFRRFLHSLVRRLVRFKSPLHIPAQGSLLNMN